MTIFALLAGNAAVFAFSGTLREALDSAAWLLLLASFGLETGFGSRFSAGYGAAVLRGARLAAAVAILAAAIGYVLEQEWLDAINSGLWIAVVALLEFEVRYAGAVARLRPSFLAATATLYAGLVVLVFAWLWRGAWFDAYDASLWLVAFATIEMSVFAAAQRAGAGPGPA